MALKKKPTAMMSRTSTEHPSREVETAARCLTIAPAVAPLITGCGFVAVHGGHVIGTGHRNTSLKLTPLWGTQSMSLWQRLVHAGNFAILEPPCCPKEKKKHYTILFTRTHTLTNAFRAKSFTIELKLDGIPINSIRGAMRSSAYGLSFGGFPVTRNIPRHHASERKGRSHSTLQTFADGGRFRVKASLVVVYACRTKRARSAGEFPAHLQKLREHGGGADKGEIPVFLFESSQREGLAGEETAVLSRVRTLRRCHCAIFFFWMREKQPCISGLSGYPSHLRPRRSGFNTGRVTLDFRMWGSCRTMPLVGGFFTGISSFPRPFFPVLSILTLSTLIGSQDTDATLPAPGGSQRGVTTECVKRVGRHVTARFLEPIRVIELRQNEMAGQNGEPRGNPPTSGIVRYDVHIRTSGVIRPEINPGLPHGSPSLAPSHCSYLMAEREVLYSRLTTRNPRKRAMRSERREKVSYELGMPNKI
ncbi:hypothetical protein PR048_012910 [Dryococelus australis]|uniref:Uncharacterized protein n=1 Tax=Dryococelus australis TaxID=614101 RepID=A0ABQ9HQP6_9NEOP|nr:hypothetical protein PR048_012910 [Dryococelus australis]